VPDHRDYLQARRRALDHIADASVDPVVIDPPYYANVMYAELSDFFYIWLKRRAGNVYPQWFRRPLTEGERGGRQRRQVQRPQGRQRARRSRLPAADGGDLR
jgi:adenine-specific DNA methylase